MADFCGACERDGLPGVDDFRGWLQGRPGFAWGLCEGCGLHLFDDAGEGACRDEGGPLVAAVGDACPACIGLVLSVRLAPARDPRTTRVPDPREEWPAERESAGAVLHLVREGSESRR